jgi:hypothetical protein
LSQALRTFHCHDLFSGEKKTIQAHYITTVQHIIYNTNETKFWISRGWFKPDDCVAILVGDHWCISNGPSDQDIAHELGIKL